MQPTGFVPGLSWGGAASSLPTAIGFNELDCIFTILGRMFSINAKGLVVIYILSWILLVILHPPLE
jgi:hypothetical protein